MADISCGQTAAATHARVLWYIDPNTSKAHEARLNQPADAFARQRKLALMALTILQDNDILLLHADTAADARPFLELCLQTLDKDPAQVVALDAEVTVEQLTAAGEAGRHKLLVSSDLLPTLAERNFNASSAHAGTVACKMASLLYRAANTHDTPSFLEQLSLPVSVPVGVTTNRQEQLPALYTALAPTYCTDTADDGIVELVTRDASGHTTSTPITSADALINDTRASAVEWTLRVLPTAALLGSTTIVVPFAHHQLLPALHLITTTAVGDAGERKRLRLSSPPPIVDGLLPDLLHTCARLLVESPVSGFAFGAFTFLLHGNAAHLVDIALGLTETVVAALFSQQQGISTSHMGVWTFSVDTSLDLWSFWSALRDNECHFHPQEAVTPTGVFPLYFDGSGQCTVLAVAPEPEGVEELWSVTHRIARQSRLGVRSPAFAGLHPSLRRIWVGSARPEYKLESQRYRLPNRCLSLMRPNLDLIVLPGNHAPTREWWQFVREVKGLSEDQAIFTSNEHFVMDDDIDEDIVSMLRAIVESNPQDDFCLLPYCVTPNFDRWAASLQTCTNVTVCGDTSAWVDEYGHKGILHRHVARPHEPSVLERIAPHVKVPRGFVCSTVADLVLAYALLGDEKVVVKPVFGAAGEGILFVSGVEALKSYTFPMGDVLVEEFLRLDRAEDGIEIAPAIHYFRETILGSSLVDQLMEGTAYAGWRRSVTSNAFQALCLQATQSILRGIAPAGPGGFDFLSVDGVPFLTDVNTGRFNGAHYPKLFLEAYAPGQSFFSFKFKPSERLDVGSVWRAFTTQGFAFSPGSSCVGVFPIVFLRGIAALFIAIADTDKEAHTMYLQAKACLDNLETAATAQLTTATPLAAESTQLLDVSTTAGMMMTNTGPTVTMPLQPRADAVLHTPA